MKLKEYRLVLLSGALIFVASLAWGHGDKKHQDSPRMSGHMAEMYQLKKQIPEEFQIMNRSPVRPDNESLANGKRLFGQHCAVCHGAEGKGDGPAAKALNPSPANFHDLKHSAIYGPGEKFWIIGNGTGKTGMPGLEKELTPKDRWDLVNHIYHLQGTAE